MRGYRLVLVNGGWDAAKVEAVNGGWWELKTENSIW